MIVDFHTHIYPSKIAQKGVSYILEFYEFHASHSLDEYGTIEHLTRTSAQAGVTHKVLLAVSVRPDQVHSINQFLASQLNDTTFGFGAIHPVCEDPLSELEQFKNLGFSGVKVHPDMQQFSIDDPRMFPIYDWVQSNEMPILLHMGDPRYEYSRPHKLAKVLELFPRLTAIASHFGGYGCWKEAEEYLSDKALFFDTSSTLPFIPAEQAKQIIRHHGAHKFLFGTDYPITTADEELQRLEQLRLTTTEMDQILYQNAKKVLKML